MYSLEVFVPLNMSLSALAYEYPFMHSSVAPCERAVSVVEGFLEALCLAGMNEPLLFLVLSKLSFVTVITLFVCLW